MLAFVVYINYDMLQPFVYHHQCLQAKRMENKHQLLQFTCFCWDNDSNGVITVITLHDADDDSANAIYDTKLISDYFSTIFKSMFIENKT